MRESTTYQAILEEGRQEGLQKGRLQTARGFLMDLGEQYLGAPPDDVVVPISAMDDIEQLRALTKRAIVARDWRELFD